MKVIIEMDALEAETAISNGALMGMLGSARDKEHKQDTSYDKKWTGDTDAHHVTQPITGQQISVPAAEATTEEVTAAPVPTAVPTEVAGYTLEQLARAGAQVVDMGKRDAVLGIFQEFGVSALSELQKDQYGAYATKLRGLGAKL